MSLDVNTSDDFSRRNSALKISSQSLDRLRLLVVAAVAVDMMTVAIDYEETYLTSTVHTVYSGPSSILNT